MHMPLHTADLRPGTNTHHRIAPGCRRIRLPDLHHTHPTALNRRSGVYARLSLRDCPGESRGNLPTRAGRRHEQMPVRPSGWLEGGEGAEKA